jgi:hypothetical protein
MDIAMQDILWAILSIAVGAIAIAAWQFIATLRRDAGENEQLRWANILVNAAEQMLGDKQGAERLDWVMAQLKARFPKLDTETIRTMVEANVKAMR